MVFEISFYWTLFFFSFLFVEFLESKAIKNEKGTTLMISHFHWLTFLSLIHFGLNFSNSTKWIRVWIVHEIYPPTQFKIPPMNACNLTTNRRIGAWERISRRFTYAISETTPHVPSQRLEQFFKHSQTTLRANKSNLSSTRNSSSLKTFVAVVFVRVLHAP